MNRTLLVLALLLISLSSARADIVGPPPCVVQSSPGIVMSLDCPSVVCVGETVTIKVNAYDLDSCLLGGPGQVDTVNQFSWYIDDVEYVPGRNMDQITVPFTTVGLKTVKVVADDAALYCDDPPATAVVMVNVQALPEQPIQAVATVSTSASGPWNKSRVDVGINQTVYFNGSDSADKDSTGNQMVDDPISTYSWDFGDAASTSGASATVSHTYSAAGVYTVSLTADDSATVTDDPLSDPAQVGVRVFADVPAAPVVVEPGSGQAYLGFNPTVKWTGEIHDQYQVKIGQVVDINIPDDPDATALWDSGVVDGDVSEMLCPTAFQENTTYYVFVREHNCLGWGPWSAAEHRFTVLDDTQLPENLFLEPHEDQQGTPYSTNFAYTFTSVYSDHCGYANIAYADLMIGDQASCYLRYDNAANCCYLLDSDGVNWIGGEDYVPGGTDPSTLENDQVKVHLGDCSVSGDAEQLTVVWSIEFKNGFTGTKPVALAVTNKKSLSDRDNPQEFGQIHIIADSGPSSIITAPTYGQYYQNNTITVTGTASDAHGIQKVEISTDGGTTWNTATGTDTWSYAWSGAGDGTYMIQSRATDNNNDVETPGSGTLCYVAATPPSSVINTPNVGELIVGDYIVVRGTASVPVAKITRVEVSLDNGVTWQQANGTDTFTYEYSVAVSGAYTIRTRAYDDLGRVENPGQTRQVQVSSEATGTPGDVPAPTSSMSSEFESQKSYQIGYSTINLCSMNVLTTIPITGWKCMGGLGIDFALYHMSSRTERPQESDGRGKDPWMTSYDMRLQVRRTSGNVTSAIVYYPTGAIEEWMPDSAGVFYNVTGQQDLLEPIAGGNGYVVTLRNKTKMYYQQQMDPDIWAPLKIEQISTVSGTSHCITFEYNDAKQLHWVKDPDGKRWLCICWKKVGPDQHDAFYGVYTSQYFNQPGEARSGRPQLWWAQYDGNGDLDILRLPYAMDYTSGNQICSPTQDADAPLLPEELRNLPGYSSDEFYGSWNSIWLGYDYKHRLNCLDEIAMLSCGYSDKGTLTGKHYTLYYDPDPNYLSYPRIRASDAYGTTTILSSGVHRQGGLDYYQGYQNIFGSLYAANVRVWTQVTDPKAHVTTYNHVQWTQGYCGYECQGSAGDNYKYYNRDCWFGFRIYSVTTTDPSGQYIRDDYYWTSSQSKNYSSLRAIGVFAPQGKLGRRIRSHGSNRYKIGTIDADTKYSWDQRGNVREVLDGITGATTRMTYTYDDLLDTVTDPADKTMKYQYMDGTRFLAKSEVDPSNLDITTDYTYDEYGNVRNVIGPYNVDSVANPPIVTTDYDTAAGGTYSLPTKITDPDGFFTTTCYSSLGLKQYQSVPRRYDSDPLAATWWDYRKDGLPYYEYRRGGTDSSTVYGGGGNVLSTRDANGKEVTYTYDRSERVKTASHYLDAEHQVMTHNTYDSVGNLASVYVYPGPPRVLNGNDVKTASYTYDCLNRQTKVTYPGNADNPDGTIITTRYDYLGNIIETKTSARSQSGSDEEDAAMAGNKIVDVYDLVSTSPTFRKLIERQYIRANGTTPERRFWYDYYPYSGSQSRGMLKRVKDSSYSSTNWAREYTYDPAGRLWDEQRYDLNRRITYQYTASGQTARLDINSIPLGQTGYTWVFHYTSGGKLSSVTDSHGGTTSFEYNDPRGRLSKKIFPGEGYTEYTYNITGPDGHDDARSLLASVHNVHSGTLDNTKSYAYDYVGNILSVTDGSEITSFGYDLAYRLTHEDARSGPWPYSYDYTYDIRGNRISRNVVAGSPSGLTSYSYDDDNSLASQTLPDNTVISYHYDAAGNLTGKSIGQTPSVTYGYDCVNNLTSVVPQSGSQSHFAYDMDGTRIRTQDSRGTVAYLYVGGDLYLEMNTDGSVRTDYTPGINQCANGTPWYFFGDAQGSTIALSGPGVLGSYKYDAWGNSLSQPSGRLTPFTYVGKEGYYSDADTGLMKLGARYYDPTVGRFITKDPARSGLNWYVYSEDNPVNLIDPTGAKAVALTTAQKTYIFRAIDLIGAVNGYGGYAIGITSLLKGGDILFDSNLCYGIWPFRKQAEAITNQGAGTITLDDCLDNVLRDRYNFELIIACTLVHEYTHMQQPKLVNDENQAYGSELSFLVQLYHSYDGVASARGLPFPDAQWTGRAGPVAGARQEVMDYFDFTLNTAHDHSYCSWWWNTQKELIF